MILTQRWRAIVVVVVACLVSSSAFTADSPPASSSGGSSIPDYMERWEFGVDAGENRGPSFFIDPIVPFYRPSDNAQLGFLEPRLAYRDHEWLLNLGGGYRRLVRDRAWVLGGNMFYDFESQYSHSRLGWGMEALSSYAEARSNIYVATSGERTVEEGAGGTIKERALPGFDMELGAPVPYYSRLKVFGGFNWYDLPDFKNRTGWTLRTEYKPMPFLVIDGTMSNDTKTNVDWGMKLAVRIPLGGNLESFSSPLQLDAAIFPESDAGGHLLNLVERHHEIVTQRSHTSPTGLTVEAGRGNS